MIVYSLYEVTEQNNLILQKWLFVAKSCKRSRTLKIEEENFLAQIIKSVDKANYR